MPLGAFLVANFRARPARKPGNFPPPAFFEFLLAGQVGVHPEVGHGISPDADDGLTEGGGDVHQAGIVGNDECCFAH